MMSKTSKAFGSRVAVATLGVSLLSGSALAFDLPFVMTPLGDLPGGDFFSSAWGINNNGVVVGTGTNDEDELTAFIWDEMSGMSAIAGVDTFAGSTARGINDNGVIVGWTSDEGSSINDANAYVIKDGMVDFIFAGNQQVKWSRAWGIEGNTVYGWVGPGNGSLQGYTYDVNTEVITQYTTTGYRSTLVRGYNANTGVAVGTSQNVDTVDSIATIWWDSMGNFTTIGPTAGYQESRATAITDSGIVIGSSGNLDFDERQAFMWTEDTGLMNLGFLAGYANSSASAINADGSIILGSAFNVEEEDGVGTYWTEDTGWVDINTLVTNLDGYRIFKTKGFNADNWVIADAFNANGEIEAVLLRPIPGPASLALLAIGGVLLSGSRRRRAQA